MVGDDDHEEAELVHGMDGGKGKREDGGLGEVADIAVIFDESAVAVEENGFIHESTGLDIGDEVMVGLHDVVEGDGSHTGVVGGAIAVAARGAFLRGIDNAGVLV